MANGYIKTFRKFTEWEWYRNTNTKALFLHCLLKANHTPKKWQGITIPQGSFVTSYQTLADELGLSVQEIRTAKRNIQSTGEITSTSTSKLTIITVLNWAKYQASDNDESTSESTTDTAENQQAINKQSTTTKNIKNERIQEEKNKEPKNEPSGDGVGGKKKGLIDQEKIKSLLMEYANGDEELARALGAYYEMRRKMKDRDTFTEYAAELILKDLDRLGKTNSEKVALVNQSVANSWKGIFPIKNTNGSSSFQKGNKGPDVEIPWLDEYLKNEKEEIEAKRRQQEAEWEAYKLTPQYQEDMRAADEHQRALEERRRKKAETERGTV